MLWRVVRSQRTRDLFFGLALAVSTAGLMAFPQACVAAAKTGLELCGNVIVPSLFPFFVLSSLVVDLGLAGYLGRALEPVMRPSFGSTAPAPPPWPWASSAAIPWEQGRLSHYTGRVSAPGRRPSGCWPSATIPVPPLSWG